MLLLFIIFLLVLIGSFIFDFYYKKTSYYQITHKPYLQIRNDTGSFGEYCIYKNLKSLEKDGAKFLFNCYLPRGNGTTTEIDVLLLHHSGIYVFESKNYSGWIFGSENSETWTQTLSHGKGRMAGKEHFLNPIFQNELHMRCLKNYIEKDVSVYSVIAFSERCEFKKMKIDNPDCHVIHRSEAINIIRKNIKKFTNSLHDDEIAEIYNLLYPCTQVSEQTKQQHIEDINNRLRSHDIKKDEIISEDRVDHLITADIQTEIEKDIDKRICPKCGAMLVLREAKRGRNKGNSFYGCSSFPKCRYIQSADN